MKTYQIVMTGGLTKNVLADTCRKQRGYLVFRLNGRIVFDVKSSDVLMWEELAPPTGFDMLEAHAV